MDDSCPDCGQKWCVDPDQVVHLNRAQPPADSVEEGLETRLLADLRRLQVGELDRALAVLSRRHDGIGRHDPSNPALADWTMLGDFHQMRVLDVACGLGDVSLALAPHAASVVALDAHLDQVQILSHLARLSHADNISAVHGDVDALAAVAGSYDRATLAGSLCRAGDICPGGTRRQSQVRLLTGIHKLLADDGELWIAAPNMLSPLGLGPRSVADGTWKVRVGRTGIERRLSEAGFNTIEFFYAILHHRSPILISSTITDNVISDYVRRVRQGTSRRSKIGIGLLSLADRVGVMGVISPALIVKATKSGGGF